MRPYARQYHPASNAICPCGLPMCLLGHLNAPKGVAVKNKKRYRRIERKATRQEAGQDIRKQLRFYA